jgi:2-C-methyl-D-erythritol 4-phosphate cytidylyltransferase
MRFQSSIDVIDTFPNTMTAENHPLQKRHFALIPAAGVGARMAAATPKQYMPIAGQAMIAHVLHAFCNTPSINHTFVVVSEQDAYIEQILADAPICADQVSILRCGGPTRAETVHNGLLTLQDRCRNDDWILVHDAARPGITPALLTQLITALKDDPVGGLLALPVVDTLKRAAQDRAIETVPRAQLWAAQTPQMFPYHLLIKAFEQAMGHISALTDDASAIELLGLTPKLIEGSPRNFKVTLAHDVALAEFLLTKD